MAKAKKVLAKVVHLYSGLELIGSKTSLNAREAEIEITALGAKVVSKKTKRVILVPWSNIKGCELIPGAEDEVDA